MEKRFIRYQLDPSDFTHDVHLGLAWININNYGLEQAELNTENQIQKFVEFVGVTNKYHMNLTLAAIRAVHHFSLKSNSDIFKDSIVKFPLLKYNFKALMDDHYGFGIYDSDRAKKEFSPPDLVPFD